MLTVDHGMAAGDYLHPLYSGPRKSEIDRAYVKAAVSGEIEQTKAPERSRVLRFILDNQAPIKQGRPRLLTNPGPLWTFERQVEAELGEYKAYFIGIERSWSILEYGLRWMPGQQKREVRLQLPQEEMLGFITAKAAILHAHVEFVLRQLRVHKDQLLRSFTSNKAGGLTKPHSRRHFKNFTGAWIDIWSPLGRPEIALFLRNVPHFFSNNRPIPFALTFQYGRDALRFTAPRSGDELDARAEAVKAELESHGGTFDVADVWWYFGPTESRLATVLGLFSATEKIRTHSNGLTATA